MTTHQATRFSGTFTLDSWDQRDDPSRDGLTISRVRLTKTLAGGLVGTSRAELLLTGTVAGARSHCGYEQVTGTVAGRTGTFALHHARPSRTPPAGG